MENKYSNAFEVILNYNLASVSLLQRKLKVSYDEAAQLIHLLMEAKVLGPFKGTEPIEILVRDLEKAKVLIYEVAKNRI